MHGLVCERATVRQNFETVVRIVTMVIGPDGGFSCTAETDDIDARGDFTDSFGHVYRNPVAGEEHFLERERLCRIFAFNKIQEHLHQGRNGVPNGDVVLVNQGFPNFGIHVILCGWVNDSSATSENAKDVVNRKVKIELGKPEYGIVCGDMKSVIHVVNGVHGPFVRNHNAFGFASASTCVDDVGDIIWSASRES